ncbi:MAG: GNAT family N-acetyltransferase [Candidatus Nanopusillus sp.]|jgi:RimJ/RimL family protein N-acetyltransferase
MKIEIDGKLINIIEGSNERVRDYIDFMNRLAQDPDNYTLSRYSKIDEQRMIEWSKSWGKNTIMILAYNDSRVVGSFQASLGKYYGLERQFHVADIAYAVDKEFRGKGLIYFLFNEAIKRLEGVKILTAWVDERNLRSSKLLIKLGFEEACKINDFIYSQTEKIFCNLIMYVGNIGIVKAKLKEELAKKNYSLYEE